MSFGIHTFNFNCFLGDFTCVFTQIRCLSGRTSGLPDTVYVVRVKANVLVVERWGLSPQHPVPFHVALFKHLQHRSSDSSDSNMVGNTKTNRIECKPETTAYLYC